MTIWALKAPSPNDYNQKDYEQVRSFLNNSIRNGISRFGWGFVNSADLTELQNKQFKEMSKDEQICWSKANFLLQIQRGDWVVNINLPDWGACFAGQVAEPYSFEQTDNELHDYRHLLKLKPDTIVEFERNDMRVLPVISSRLKLQGRYWTIQYRTEFQKTMENIRINHPISEGDNAGLLYLKEDLDPALRDITGIIQKNHPAGKLEEFIAEVIRKVPNVVSVSEHGKHKGWGTDNGADLIVNYKTGLSISNLEKEEVMVVQIKSYTGQHRETYAVDQVEHAIGEFDAACGLLITTAEKTKELESAVEALGNKLNKPVGLLAGEEVAKFVLKYGGELLF